MIPDVICDDSELLSCTCHTLLMWGGCKLFCWYLWFIVCSSSGFRAQCACLWCVGSQEFFLFCFCCWWFVFLSIRTVLNGETDATEPGTHFVPSSSWPAKKSVRCSCPPLDYLCLLLRPSHRIPSKILLFIHPLAMCTRILRFYQEFLVRSLAALVRASWPVRLFSLRHNVQIPPAQGVFVWIFVSSCWCLRTVMFWSTGMSSVPFYTSLFLLLLCPGVAQDKESGMYDNSFRLPAALQSVLYMLSDVGEGYNSTPWLQVIFIVPTLFVF